MSLLLFLAPASLLLGGLGLAAFWWTVHNGQYDDPQGDAARILYDHEAEGPDPTPVAGAAGNPAAGPRAAGPERLTAGPGD